MSRTLALVLCLSLVCLGPASSCFSPSDAVAQEKKKKKKRRGRRKSKKQLAKERKAAEARRALVERFQREVPGYLRWWRSILRPQGQAKITRVDMSKAPAQVRLHLSILTVDENNILQSVKEADAIKKIKVMVASGDQRVPKLRALFEGAEAVGSNDDKDDPRWSGTLIAMEDAQIPLDAVVIGAGHGGYRGVDTLEDRHQKAVSRTLRRLGSAGARVNVMWYASMLYTYRSFAGFEGDLARYDEAVTQCEIDRLKHKIASYEKPEEGKEKEEQKDPPCGLQRNAGAVGNAVEGRRFRGRYGRLFGIDRRCSGPNDAGCIHQCSKSLLANTAIDHVDLDELENPTADTGAFEEALRMLIKYGKPDSRKVIVIFSDGRDGHVDEDSACRRLYTEKKDFCAEEADKIDARRKKEKKKPLSAKAARKAIQACVQRWLDKRSTLVQEEFAKKAVPWLALMRAMNIRVFVVAYAMVRDDDTLVSYPFERERLELLALKTGGTYREVYKPSQIPDFADATVAELQNERVLVLDADLASEETYKLRLQVEVEQVTDGSEPYVVPMDTALVQFTAPFYGEGFWFWAKQKNAWLKDKVGTILYWVIVVLAILLVLLILFLIFKLFKAIIMKIVKAFAKKGKDAAKKSAKGGK